VFALWSEGHISVWQMHLARPLVRNMRLAPINTARSGLACHLVPAPDATSQRSPPEVIAGAHPTVWLLIGDKLGDNAQALALADALGWPYQVRQVFPQPEWVLGKPRFVPGLHHLDPERSASSSRPGPTS
jgi:hypothetical protein